MIGLGPAMVREALKEEVGFRILDREGLDEGKLQDMEIQGLLLDASGCREIFTWVSGIFS